MIRTVSNYGGATGRLRFFDDKGEEIGGVLVAGRGESGWRLAAVGLSLDGAGGISGFRRGP